MKYRIRVVTPTGLTDVDENDISSDDFQDVLSSYLDDVTEPGMRVEIRTYADDEN